MQLLTISQFRHNVFMFILAGLFAYLIDYKRFKQTNQREAAFIKYVTYVYIIGGAILLIVYQVLNWMV